MKLSDLLKDIKPISIKGDAEAEITGVDIDSRRVGQGHLFVAMKGTQVDGHKFIPKAIELGAAAVLCEDLPEALADGVTYVQVASTEEAVGPVATLFYGNPSKKLKLVGVTGTNGKTTIATLLYNMFRQMGHKCGLLSTVCNYIEGEPVPADHTTPDPIELNELLHRMVEAGCEYAFMEQEELSLTGKHNIYNSLAAGLASNISGIKKDIIRKSLSDFPGVEHRLEKVCKVRGVQYVNDSKATNVDGCWYALESMKTPVILILGGKDKGNDYNAIKELVKKKCTGLVYLGADNTKLHNFFDGMGIPVRDTHSMKDCVEACYDMAKTGETVLLSPCCASFDLFKNMEDRGEQFKTLVRNL